ncbi:XRE family transcriptional regulator [Mesorhizobium sp. M2A.F.Ca.ET.042.01.1.1]|uniref:helix-turn-helix domain-containing protein n=1 Tax=Mesorhizobium sp. M2A.F.Ca.ET.042.01.1.1 TaxID=2496745 RepID=UPI000FCBD663|nr:XRE family transcriptional regulator [Mesorhizobium sp. M2A.F.Ca.ET.042.01.1.1]
MAPLTPEQVIAARTLLNWPRVRLGAKCDLSEASIREFERGGRVPSAEKLLAMRQVLQAAGVAFFGQDSSGKPVVRLHPWKAPHATNLAGGEAGIIGNSEM